MHGNGGFAMHAWRLCHVCMTKRDGKGECVMHYWQQSRVCHSCIPTNYVCIWSVCESLITGAMSIILKKIYYYLCHLRVTGNIEKTGAHML